MHRALATFRQGAAGETREALDAVLGDDARELVVEDPPEPFDLRRDSGTLLFLGRLTDPSTT